MSIIAKIFRRLPLFRGKLRIGAFFLKKQLYKKNSVEFTGKNKIHYTIPNTIETVGRELFLNGVYENETIKLISKLLNKNAVFFDVGANIGAISLPLAKINNITIYAFEPSIFNFKYLETNVLNNNLRSISLNNCAVYSKDNIDIEFYATENKFGGSSLAPTYSQVSYSVKTVSLDEYCKKTKIDKIDVLKIDVQGFEIAVLEGCYSLIKNKAIKNIIFEFEAWAEHQANHIPGTSQQFLLENGYEIFNLKNKKIDKKIVSGSHMLWAKPK